MEAYVPNLTQVCKNSPEIPFLMLASSFRTVLFLGSVAKFKLFRVNLVISSSLMSSLFYNFRWGNFSNIAFKI